MTEYFEPEMGQAIFQVEAYCWDEEVTVLQAMMKEAGR